MIHEIWHSLRQVCDRHYSYTWDRYFMIIWLGTMITTIIRGGRM